MVAYQNVLDADQQIHVCDQKFPKEFKDVLQIKENIMQRTTYIPLAKQLPEERPDHVVLRPDVRDANRTSLRCKI